MNEYLYKLQLCGYDHRAYRALIAKPTTGQVNNTARIKRLRVVTVLLCVLGWGLPCCWLAHTVLAADTLLKPYERWRNRRFMRRATRTLARRPDLIKIGITGSYGKTSVKNILAALLGSRYRVVASPHSFNTPLGLARTINEHLAPDTQVLIMEMGARRPGEIRELCTLLHPDHGIITSIGACHLETFGNLATVAATKAELFHALPATGYAVTDGENPWCRGLTHSQLILVSRPQPPYATQLLGEHNQTNLALAVALAQKLGVDAATCTRVIAELKPTPHRLESLTAPNGIHILDDSYNANPASATAALAVLKTCAGRKVVQTPGLVEQGEASAAANQTLGEQMAAVADAVIIVGAVNRAALTRGLAQFSGPVKYAATRDAAQNFYPELLTAGDTLLILNDLPENY